MTETVDPKKGFFDRLDEVAARGDKFPDWKMRGWALLDFEDKTSKNSPSPEQMSQDPTPYILQKV